ncbi:2-dehydropantoate 2-reductase [Pseudomonas sp. G166]|uniref:ketopantoate reductase family protein n=1 Tax=Pseudomonas sp. G166 TaxID=3094846 RepID=UPI003008491F
MSVSNALRVSIVGAGAIGCTLAARIANSGQPVSMLARGKTLEVIRSAGVTLFDLEGECQATVRAESDCAALGIQDVIFICTKATALSGLLPELSPLVGPETIVVPVVNGVPWWYFHGVSGRHAGRRIEAVNPDGNLSACLNLDQILGCVIFITAHTESPGVVRSNNKHLMILGEPNNQLSERLELVRTLIERSGIEARASETIRDALWTKILANLTSNPLSVITGASLEQIYSQPELKTIVSKVFNEALVIAGAYGARIAFDPQTFMTLWAGMGNVRTSMLQDHDAGRPLELAAIGDAVVELAALQGIDMPVTKDILALARIRALNTSH